MEIAFVGNPNTGKTALINAIAGSDLEVGNWSGVTVEKKEVTFTYKNEKIHLVDLPGTYTLSPYSIEEKITREVICSDIIDGIINVVNSTDLRRNLYLTLELIDLQKPLLLALNMFDEFKKRGFSIDIEKFSKLIDIDVIPTIASRGLGKKEIIEKIYQNVKNKKIPKPFSYQEHIEKEIEFLINKMKNIECNIKRFLAVKLLENDEFAKDKLKDYPQILKEAKNARERLKAHFGMDVKKFIVEYRYQKIDEILEKTLKKPIVDKVMLSDKLDNILLNKYLGIPIFFVIMFLVFQFTFSGSEPLVDWTNWFFQDYLADKLKILLSPLPNWIASLTIDGVIAGVGLVLSFLPLLAFLYFFMAVLQESGYMARISFLLDKLASKVGLKGNGFIPLILGFGCNVPAIYSTRSMSTFRERVILALMIPFMSCSARFPIYVLFASLFFAHYKAFVILSLYSLGIFIAFIIAFIANKILPKNEVKPFFLELPTYHIPTLKAIWNLMWPNLKDFLVRAGTLIVFASVILWGVMNLPPKSTPKSSYLAKFSKEISPIFKPLGFGEHWEVVAPLIPGTLAKEVVISSMGTIYGVELNSIDQKNSAKILKEKIRSSFPNAKAAFAYLVFILLYIPCVSTMAAIKAEFGWKLMLLEITLLPIIAYIVSFIIYQILILL